MCVQVCGREFNRKDNLREHLRAHAGQTKRKKKYTCGCCGIECEATDILKLHKKIHNGRYHFLLHCVLSLLLIFIIFSFYFFNCRRKAIYVRILP